MSARSHDDIARLLARHRPGYRVRSVTGIGQGTDHAAYDVNGELVVRFGTAADPAGLAAATRREAQLLRAVAARSPVPTPVPELVLAGEGCLVYRRLPGVPLLQLAAHRRRDAALPRTLGAFLTAVHGMAVDEIAEVDDVPLEEWRAEAAGAYAQIAPRLSTEQRRAAETFLAAPLPDAHHDPVFCHNDLGAEHLLADPATGRLSAVIDWGDAAIADPAHDFGLLLRDFGSRALDEVIGHYDGPIGDREALRRRAAFHARCKTLEDIAYGLEAGRREYVDNGLAALAWLFDPDLAHG